MFVFPQVALASVIVYSARAISLLLSHPPSPRFTAVAPPQTSSTPGLENDSLGSHVNLGGGDLLGNALGSADGEVLGEGRGERGGGAGGVRPKPSSEMERRLRLLLSRQEEVEAHVERLQQLGPGEGSRRVAGRLRDGDGYGWAGEEEGACDDGGQAVRGAVGQVMQFDETSQWARKREGAARPGGAHGSMPHWQRRAAAFAGAKGTRDVSREEEEEGSSDSASLLLQDLTTEFFLK